MGDPLSTAASVIAVIQLCSEVAKYVSTARGAAKERKDILREVRACGHILERLHDEADDSDEGKAWSETIKALEAPGAPLGRLLITLQAIGATLQPKHGIKGAVENLAWPFKEKEVYKILASIEREKSVLHLALENNSRKLIQEIRKTANDNRKLLEVTTRLLKGGLEKSQSQSAEVSRRIGRLETSQGGLKEGLDRLQDGQDNQHAVELRRNILSWITSIDYAPQQNDFINRRQAETGQWLLDSDKFQTWLENDKQTLFCPGIPGAGKTILASIVIDDLVTRFRDDKSIAVVYIYCNFRRQDEQTAVQLLASLLKQLAQGPQTILDSVIALYDKHRDKQSRPSPSKILAAIRSMTALYSKVFLIVDAIDEISFEDRDEILSSVSSLQQEGKVNIFVTSRPEVRHHFAEHFTEYATTEIRASDHDILAHVNGRLAATRRPKVSHFPDLQDAIRARVVGAADGMFLLAKLHVDYLLSKSTPGDIRDALEDIPRGIAGLDALYDHAMERINSLNEGRKETMHKILSWITHARRPLLMTEIQCAAAVRPKATELRHEYLHEVEDLISDCAGLVTLDEQSGIIRLVHYTAQEYFEQRQKKWFPNAEAEITTTCITYLSFDTFDGGFCETDDEFEERLRTNRLYDYAAHNWGHHAFKSSTLPLEVLEFLKSQRKVEAAGQALLASKRWPSHLEYSQETPRQVAGLHLAAYFGIKDAVGSLLDGTDPDLKDGLDQTPLSWAARNGHDDVVKQLLDRGADTESKDSRHLQTPLSWAAENGHAGVVKLLLDNGADIESTDLKFGQTPLGWAADEGHEGVVKQLLDRNAEMEPKDIIYGSTALLWAAENGHEGVVKLLLDKGANIESTDKDCGQTALTWAAMNGHEGVVRRLLEKGANVNAIDNSGLTALQVAVFRHHDTTEGILTSYGAHVSDCYGLEWLFSAGE